MTREEAIDIVKDFRTRNFLSQKDLAELIGVSSPYIYMLERGERISIRQVKKIASFFYFNVNVFLSENQKLAIGFSALREKCKLSLNELKDITGIPYNALQQIEMGSDNIPSSAIKDITKKLFKLKTFKEPIK